MAQYFDPFACSLNARRENLFPLFVESYLEICVGMSDRIQGKLSTGASDIVVTAMEIESKSLKHYRILPWIFELQGQKCKSQANAFERPYPMKLLARFCAAV